GSAGPIVDLGERILLPGLINAHCHLDYTALRGRISAGGSFTDWIRAINAEKAKLTPENYVESIRAGIAESKSFGTTSIVNFEAFPELAAELATSLRMWWLAELIDVRAPESAGELIRSATKGLKGTRHWGLAPHALFTASE